MKKAYVVSSLSAIPPALLEPGNQFWVANRDGTYTIFQCLKRPDGTLEGWSELFAQLGQVGAQLGAQYFQASAANSANERAINLQFDNLARQTTALFQTVNGKGNAITVEDFRQAATAYQALKQLAGQYPTSAITEWWSSPDYDQAYQRDLELFAQRLQATGQPVTSGGAINTGGISTLPAQTDGGSNTLLIIGGLLIALVIWKSKDKK